MQLINKITITKAIREEYKQPLNKQNINGHNKIRKRGTMRLSN